MRHRRGVILVFFALIVAVVAVTSSLALVGSGGSGPATTVAGTTAPVITAAPDPADVAAARACQAWDEYLSVALGGTVSTAQGQALLTAAEALIAGAQQDQTAGRPLPKWEELGGDIIDGADDVVNGNTEALQSDGDAVAQQCKTIPAAAMAAGGFVGSSPSS